MQNKFFHKYKYILLLLFLPFLVFWRNMLPLLGKVFFGNDAILSFYTLASIVHQLKEGSLPLWDPYTFFGVPLIPRPDSLVFYPPIGLLVIISAALDVSDSVLYWLMEAMTVLHFSLAGIFTYVLLKKYKLSDFSAFIGGLAYMFCGGIVAFANTTGLQISMAYFPLVLLFFDRLIKKPSLRKSLVFSVVYALPLTTFALTSAIVYHLIFFLFYYLFLLAIKETRFDRDTIIFTALGFILSITTAAVVMFPGFLVPLISDRALVDFHISAYAGNLKPRQLFDFLIPYLSAKNYGETEVLNLYYALSLTFTYSGILTLLLIAPAFFRRNAYVVFFFASAVFWMLFALGGETPVFGTVYLLFYPIMKPFSEARLSLYIPQFCIAVLAGYGIENMTVHFEAIKKQSQQYKKTLVHLLLISCLAAFILFFRIDQFLWAVVPSDEKSTPMMSQQNAFMIFLIILALSVGVIFLLGKIKFSYAKLFIFLVLFFDLFLFAEKYPINNTGIDPQQLLSKNTVVNYLIKDNTKLFYRSDVRDMPHNYTPALYKINHIVGYLVYFPRIPLHFFHLLTTNPRNDVADSIASVRYIVTESKIEQSPYQLVFEKQITAKDQAHPLYYHLASSGWVPMPEGTNLRVYENMTYLPLARIMHAFRFVTEAEAQTYLEQKSVNATSEALIDRKHQPEVELANDPHNAPASVSILTGKNYEKKITTKSQSSGVLVTSLPFYDDWRVEVDGSPKTLLRVNLSFMGVSLPAGDHVVRFYYVPIVFFAGLLTTLLSTSIVILVLVFYKDKRSV